MPIPDLDTRRQAIRFPAREIARVAELDCNTVARAVRGAKGARRDTVERIEQALVAEELRLRDYLIGLHGVPTGENE